jgi:hypothetical protein
MYHEMQLKLTNCSTLSMVEAIRQSLTLLVVSIVFLIIFALSRILTSKQSPGEIP